MYSKHYQAQHIIILETPNNTGNTKKYHKHLKTQETQQDQSPRVT